MRIDQNLPIAETVQSELAAGTKTGQANSTSQSGGTSSSSATPNSGVTLFSQKLQATLEATPDIRQDKVEALQKAMQNGTYHVSSQDLASAMYDTMVQKTKQ